jgi:hypothetical protein
MKRVEYQLALLTTVATLAAGSMGCTDSSNLSAGPSGGETRTLQKSGPEDSFDVILETFRRGVEGVKIGFVARREGGHSMMSGDNKVSHELIPPRNDGDPYKAIITVESQSSYSLQRTITTDDHEENNNSGSKNSSPGLGSEDNPVDILDSDLVGNPTEAAAPSRAQANVDSTTIARRPQAPTKKSYELQYENGRWGLVTKLDPETEQGIKNAFDHALKTQI